MHYLVTQVCKLKISKVDTMTDEIKSDKTTETTIQNPRPSSPRKFFARLYGHLEEPKAKSPEAQAFDSESSSDVEVEESDVRMEGLDGRVPTVWPLPPPPLPLCPRPMILPHQQLAFGAGLAAFRKFTCFRLNLLQSYLNIGMCVVSILSYN